MPFIAHTTKIWTVFYASSITNVFTFYDGFHTPLFAIIASHTVSRRVSDRSVVLPASCSSDLEVYLCKMEELFHMPHDSFDLMSWIMPRMICS